MLMTSKSEKVKIIVSFEFLIGIQQIEADLL